MLSSSLFGRGQNLSDVCTCIYEQFVYLHGGAGTVLGLIIPLVLFDLPMFLYPVQAVRGLDLRLVLCAEGRGAGGGVR